MYDPDLSFFPPANIRTHEVCGPGAEVFAFALAARLAGNVMWIRESWEPRQINPNGFASFIDPSNLTLCNTNNQIETLAVAEETLRSGAASLVVMTLTKPLGLTEGRRLQLAARDGKSTGLTILPEGMGSNAAETRWHCAPVFDANLTAWGSTLQKWELIKNKSGTLGAWYVRWDPAARCVIVVPPAGE